MRNIIFKATLIFISFIFICSSCEKIEDDPNVLPICKIITPTDGQEILGGERITILANASDTDGDITELAFYIDGYEVGKDNSEPFTFEWQTFGESISNHTIKIIATDNSGENSSDEISITLIEENNFQLQFKPVLGGTFLMGTENGSFHEKPVHTVSISSFEMSTYEVSNKQFCYFLNDISCPNGGVFQGETYLYLEGDLGQIFYSTDHYAPLDGKENHPAIVTWFGANAFAQWIGGRLPTEAEWEFAAKGGALATETLYSGSNNLNEVAWYYSNSNYQTHPVGSKLPNELGLYDMSGNVWEWCSDWFDSAYYSNSPANDPQGPATSSSNNRVLRGSCSSNEESSCYLARRNGNTPISADNLVIGFRVAK